MANEPRTLQEAILYFADPDNCQNFMIELRWPDAKVRCPHCGSEHVTYLENARLYKCYGKHEKAKFSLKVRTIFEDSPIGLDKWFTALWLIVNCKNGISSYEIGRDLGISQKSAWHLAHRIRYALRQGSFEKFSGECEVDEPSSVAKHETCISKSGSGESPGLAARIRLPLWAFWSVAERSVPA